MRFLSQLFKRGPVPLPLSNVHTAGASRPLARPPFPDSTRTSMLASAIERPGAATMAKSMTNHDTFLFMIKKREGKKKDKKVEKKKKKEEKKKRRKEKKPQLRGGRKKTPKTQNSELKTQNSNKAQNSKLKTQNSNKAKNSKLKAQNLGPGLKPEERT